MATKLTIFSLTALLLVFSNPISASGASFVVEAVGSVARALNMPFPVNFWQFRRLSMVVSELPTGDDDIGLRIGVSGEMYDRLVVRLSARELRKSNGGATGIALAQMEVDWDALGLGSDIDAMSRLAFRYGSARKLGLFPVTDGDGYTVLRSIQDPRVADIASHFPVQRRDLANLLNYGLPELGIQPLSDRQLAKMSIEDMATWWLLIRLVQRSRFEGGGVSSSIQAFADGLFGAMNDGSLLSDAIIAQPFHETLHTLRGQSWRWMPAGRHPFWETFGLNDLHWYF